MTFVACVLFIIANLAAMLLFWMYKKQTAHGHQEKEDGKKSSDDTNNNSHHDKEVGRKGSIRPHHSHEQDTSVFVTNKYMRQSKRTTGSSSLLSMLGLSYNGYKTFFAFEDKFVHFEDVAKACRNAGLEKCGLIMGVDFSASNEWQGRKTFSSRNLHDVVPGKLENPYQKVISIIGRTLESFDDDNLIPAFGFGDALTTGKGVFPLTHQNVLDWREDEITKDIPCKGFIEVLEKYKDIANKVSLGGPTDYAPIIFKALDIVKQTKKYHILIVITDGQVTEETSTIHAIVEASKHPLSIVMVGVGDGPWDLMERFDDCLPERSFDNFQFVNFHAAVLRYKKNPDASFALHAMMEIPDQYKTIKTLGYLKEESFIKSTVRAVPNLKRGRVASSMIGAIEWLKSSSRRGKED